MGGKIQKKDPMPTYITLVQFVTKKNHKIKKKICQCPDLTVQNQTQNISKRGQNGSKNK